jgi:membrane protein involved in colicin uptake
MKISPVMRAGLIAASLAAMAGTGANAFAQTRPAVMIDTEPLPAEERDSLGAVVLETSMVRAQRDAFAARYTPQRVGAVGRNADRTARAARAKEDLAQQREDAQIRLHEMGAGALTPP